MAGGGSLLKLKGCKFWYADYYSGGKRIRVSTREENKSDARTVLNKLLAERDEGLPQTDRSLRIWRPTRWLDSELQGERK